MPETVEIIGGPMDGNEIECGDIEQLVDYFCLYLPVRDGFNRQTTYCLFCEEVQGVMTFRYRLTGVEDIPSDEARGPKTAKKFNKPKEEEEDD